MLNSKLNFINAKKGPQQSVARGKFSLENEPIAFQIQTHLNNMQHTRERMNVYSMSVILDYAMNLLAHNTPEIWIENQAGVHFRLAQVIQYYGKAEVADYIKLVYGREVAK